MRLLARYNGYFGQIDVVERKADGVRLYLEEGIFQSQATRSGEAPFSYIRLMHALLQRASNILLIGCAGGTLATSLVHAGKVVTVVDRNPISFLIAQRFFGMPETIPCATSDFREFLTDNQACFNGIAIDVSGPGFSARETFNLATCELVRSRLAPDGRVVINLSAGGDNDPLPDWVAARLAGDDLRSWIFDHPGRGERNVIVTCVPETKRPAGHMLNQIADDEDGPWACRRGRVRLSDLCGVRALGRQRARPL
jgi:hypothetical protein